MVGKRQEAVTPGWGSGVSSGSTMTLSALITAVATSQRGAHITGVSRGAQPPSLSLALCARLAGQGPSVRDLATSPLWQRVREGGGIIPVREGEVVKQLVTVPPSRKCLRVEGSLAWPPSGALGDPGADVTTARL